MKLPITVPARNVRKLSSPSNAPRWFDKCERKAKLCLAFSVVCIVFTWILFRLELLPWVSTRHQNHFILVIDAGSTGTRLFGFSYVPQMGTLQMKPLPPEAAAKYIPSRPGIRAYNRIETLPGLQTLTLQNFEDAQNSTKLIDVIQEKGIDPLLKWARAVVPSSVRKTTPICLFASAGVREMDQTRSEALIHVIHSIMAHSGFKYNPQCIEVIAGNEEGVFGWVSLNYHLGNFNNISHLEHHKKRPHKSSIQSKELRSGESSDKSLILDDKDDLNDVRLAPDRKQQKWIGAMDLGGASLEITFPTDDELSSKISIQGTRYWLESRTFEHLGLNKAFETSLALISGKKTHEKAPYMSQHPCLHQGYQSNETIQTQRGKTQDVAVEGKASWEECKTLAKQVILTSLTCEADRCLPLDFMSPDHRLIGMNGFYVVLSFFNLTKSAPLALLETKGKEFCSRDWEEVNGELKDVVLLRTYCFRAAYVLSLSESLLRMNIARDNLEVASQSISWPLGAALLRIDDMHHHHKKRLKLRDFGKWLFFIISFGCLGFVCFKNCFIRSSRDRDQFRMSELGQNRLRNGSLFGQTPKFKRRNGSYKRLNTLTAV